MIIEANVLKTDYRVLMSREQPITAFILCAGLGTRLKPLTDTTPKCLIDVGEKPVLEHILGLLHRYGIYKPDIIINYQRFYDQFLKYQEEVIFSHETELLETAGALKKAEAILSDPFIVINGDTITNLNLRHMMAYHFLNGAFMTVFTKDNLIHNGGTLVMDKRILKYIPLNKPYSLHQDLLPDLIKRKKKIVPYNPEHTYYFDIGTPEKLDLAREFFEK